MAAVEKFGTTCMVCDSYRHMQFCPCLSIYLINREWTKTQVSKSWVVVYRRKQQFSRERKGDSRMYFSMHFDAIPEDRAVFSMTLQDLLTDGSCGGWFLFQPANVSVQALQHNLLTNPWDLQISASADLLCSVPCMKEHSTYICSKDKGILCKSLSYMSDGACSCCCGGWFWNQEAHIPSMLNWLSALITSSYNDWLWFCNAVVASAKVPWSKSGHLSSSTNWTLVSFSCPISVHGNTLFSRIEFVLCGSNPILLLPLLPVLPLLLGLTPSQ